MGVEVADNGEGWEDRRRKVLDFPVKLGDKEK